MTVAQGFVQHLRGLRAQPDDVSMLLRASSVHGFGMSRDLVVVGLDRRRRVLGSRVLKPNRVVGFWGARYVLEMPAGTVPPAPGEELELDV